MCCNLGQLQRKRLGVVKAECSYRALNLFSLPYLDLRAIDCRQAHAVCKSWTPPASSGIKAAYSGCLYQAQWPAQLTEGGGLRNKRGRGRSGGWGSAGKRPASEGHGFLQLLQSLLLLNLLLFQPLYQLQFHCALQAQPCQQKESHQPSHTSTAFTIPE